MHNFRKLKAWNASFTFTKQVYKVTNKFPKEEVFGLTSQIRRSAVSIPSNIAEGCGRGTDKQLMHFLDIAQGSACELETQLLLAMEMTYMTKNEGDVLIQKLQEVQKMIQGFKKTLR